MPKGGKRKLEDKKKLDIFKKPIKLTPNLILILLILTLMIYNYSRLLMIEYKLDQLIKLIG